MNHFQSENKRAICPCGRWYTVPGDVTREVGESLKQYGYIADRLFSSSIIHRFAVKHLCSHCALETYQPCWYPPTKIEAARELAELEDMKESLS